MSRILLAHHMATIRISHPNERCLAICLVGAQHNGTLPHGNTIAHVPCHRNRLLHQIGRSRAPGTIIEKNVQNFVWKSIICRFGIPRVFVFDIGKQFNNNAFRDFCQ